MLISIEQEKRIRKDASDDGGKAVRFNLHIK